MPETGGCLRGVKKGVSGRGVFVSAEREQGDPSYIRDRTSYAKRIR